MDWNQQNIETKAIDCVRQMGTLAESIRLSFMRTEKINPDHAVITFCGGLNLIGDENQWQEYFVALSQLINLLHDAFGMAWTVNLENDCLDDVFYIQIGVANRDFDLDDYDSDTIIAKRKRLQHT